MIIQGAVPYKNDKERDELILLLKKEFILEFYK